MSDTTTLPGVQAWLLGAVTAPCAPSSLAPLCSNKTFPAAAGLEVYRRAYVARVNAAMRTQFPALCHALGATLFDDFAADYLQNYPPRSYTLHDLGDRFVTFLEADRPDRYQPTGREVWIDFLVDLARFERAVFELFDALGAEGCPLAGHDTDDDRLRLQPAVRLGRYAFDVAHYHHAARRAERPRPPSRTELHVALIRTDYVVRTIVLQPSEYIFLTAMTGGGSISDGFVAVAAARNIPLQTVLAVWHNDSTLRSRWIDLGLFAEHQKGHDEPSYRATA